MQMSSAPGAAGIGGVHLDTLATSLVVAALLVAAVLWACRGAGRARPGGTLAVAVSGSLQLMDRNVSAGPLWARRRIGALAFALFWFILLSHWLHLLPALAVEAPTADISVTVALAVVTLVVVHLTAAQATGWRRYAARYLSPAYLFPVRIAEDVVRVLSLSLRLFGVLLAGAVIVEVVSDIMPPPASVVPLVLWTGFDLVMAVLQAYIFAVLATTYYNLAATSAAPDEGAP